ncbi:hypothetical protein A2690_02055 [Candidatus Roizmanbacteria bacterium RIFCSPHIGHO2_01_FULL_39_12b]|uniref:Uncharacterized protein n=1 Tax=Candidatus Roizmanbacteria bacterium RIFCSPHIGHO2_01_FULL_39_12b TaxID=1802030 RepID=A0A1F7GE40_9BACT|nr:MAG: hypothetical protein A2690_02055 [Candidatus Roizmanbacteria bacterium RIFCSPHIGHO2_01_FULL_39_12b]OGK46312.1 MAG: hypothetical protein A3B46_00025 [Candidatus Roizmanbacteria bacterium RIFCSPLOWO2_01_FULL_39_19]
MFNLSHFLMSSFNLATSKLFDGKTFYKAFIQDLENCKEEVIIESPIYHFFENGKIKTDLQKALE